MWCLQKPGHEAFLLAELQRQQQCSQFCDTMLKAGGVSVPAHGCILSAISPHISSALSSSPTPPSGQSHLLEFQALGSATLLHIVRLFYCGEMAGEGESEKQEAIYAAANLGISGLVEVTKSRGQPGGGAERYTEMGVQTEEDEVRGVSWRREMRDEFTRLWKETLSDRRRDVWTQTEEELIHACAPVSSVVPYQTIDMSVLQTIAPTDSHQVVPVTIIYPPDQNQTLQYVYAPPEYLQEPTTSAAAQHAPQPPYPLPGFPTHTVSCVADSQSCVADPDPEEGEDELLERFQGNIPGFISNFRNVVIPEDRESPRRGRAGRRPRGARAARTGPQRTRTPRGRAGGRGRGRGGLTQMVDVQEIGVGKLQKVFLHRWRVSTPRTGLGGGAVGRKVFQKTREELEPTRKGRSRRRRGKVFEVGQSQDVQPGSDEANAWCRKTTPQLTKASNPVGRDQNCRDRPAPGYHFVPSKNICGGSSLTSSSPSLRQMRSPAAQTVSPGPSCLHSPQSAPLAPPPLEDPPEDISRLIDEVLAEQKSLQSNKATNPLPTSSDTSGNFSVQNKQQAQVSSSEFPVLQQQRDGELADVMLNLLQLFEQNINSSNTRKENETLGSLSEASDPDAASRNHRTVEIHGGTPHRAGLQSQVNCSETPGVLKDDSWVSGNSAGTLNKTIAPTRRQKRRRAKTYLFSLEKRRVSERRSTKKRTPSQDRNAASAQAQKEPQVTAEVKLGRNSLLSVRATLQGHNCEISEEKSALEAKECSVKNSRSGPFRKNWVTKSYPIRSRFRKAQIQDLMPFLQQNLVEIAECPRRCGPGRPRKKGNLLGSPPVDSTKALVQPQSMASCNTNDQMENNPVGQKEDVTVQSLEEVRGPRERGLKRGAESMKETSDADLVGKRICLDQTTIDETSTSSPQSADFPPAAATLEPIEEMDVEAVSVSSSTDLSQEIKQEEPISEAEDASSGKDTESIDEIIDVEEDQEDSSETVWHKEPHLPEERCSASPSHPNKEFSLEWMGKGENFVEDEDIDVIGGSGPAPEPVIISWIESSEGEEEVDVVGEKTDGPTSSRIILAES